MTATQGPFLAAVLLLVSSGLLWSFPLPACPEPCACQRAPLLNCSSSGLSSVPQSIPDSVTELDLSHNLLDSVALGRPYHHLRNVWLGNNSITRLSLCIESNLVGRYVRGRHLHRLRPWSRRGCVSWAPTLQLLSVERNQLEQLPEGLEGSESLQVLQLSFNRISTLRPGDLSHLQQLMELHLQHNLITSLHPQMFQDLAQLRVLDLSFNMLTSLHPLTYLSLRNIGADVRLGGNKWNCDCSMRSLRRRMAYDSSRGLQAWSMVCASPSVLADRDLLQLEEDDLNCFSTQNRPESHQDVTVYSGSEILLSCSSQDSVWWMPHGQASVQQPQAGLVINDITERDTGLYVCMSEENKVLSVFNLQISKIGGPGRKARSLTRTSRQIIPQGTPNRIGQPRNQTATESELVLAVCLSVFITFLVAFILGVLARPCIDVLWRRVTKKKSSPEANSASTAGQRQYDNEGYSSGDEPDEIGTHRERRITYRKNGNVQYCTTERVARTAGNSGSENSMQPTTSEENQQAGRDLSGITGGKRNTESEHIPDPVELEKRRSSSSSSDSSVYDKDQMIKRNHRTPKFPQLAEDSAQQAEVPQNYIESTEIPGFSSEPFADWSPHTKNTNITDPDLQQENEEQFEFSDSARSISARSSSTFGSFKDSKLIVATTSDKQKGNDMSSSSSSTSGHEPTDYTVNSDQEREEDIERNHSKPEISNAFLNQDDTFQLQIHGVNPILPSVAVGAARPKHSGSSSSSDSDEEDQKETERKDKSNLSSRIVTEEPDTRRKVEPMPRTKWRIPSLAVTTTSHIKSLDTRAPSPPAASSSSSSSESEVDTINLKVEQNTNRVNEGIKINKLETLSTDLDHQHIPQIKSRLDFNTQLPTSDSTSSDESTDETTKYTKRQVQGGKHMAGIPTKDYQSVGNDPMKPQWPSLDFGNVTPIKRRLDIRAPSTAADSSSSSESADETMDKTQKHRETQVKSLQTQPSSQPVSHGSDKWWPALDLEHIPHVKRRLDIKAPSPTPESSSSSDTDAGPTGHTETQDQGQMHMVIPPIKVSHKPQITSSSSSDSEDEMTNQLKKQEKGKTQMTRPAIKVSQTVNDDTNTQRPARDLEHTTHVKRRLDIQAPAPPSDSSSSSDSEDEMTNQLKKQEKGKTQMTRPAIKVPQTVNHDTNTQRPARDLEHTTHIKRHPDSSSSSDSEDGPTGHTEMQKQGQMHMVIPPITASHKPQTQWPVRDLGHTTDVKRRLDIQAPSPPSDSSSSSDSADETIDKTQKHRETQVKSLQSQPSSQPVSHGSDKWWPALDLEHIPHVKRRLDIKAPSPTPESSSSSDTDAGPTGHTETQDQGQMHMVIPPIKVSHKPQITSSSSSDSEDEMTNQLKKQEKGKTQMTRPAIKVPQTVNHDTNTERPARDLEHTIHIKRHPDSSSSSDSEDGPTDHTDMQKQGQMHMVIPPITASHKPQTQWPVLDLGHTTHVKRRLDIQAPSPPSDSSSSSDSEDEITNQLKKQEKGKTQMTRPAIKVPQTVQRPARDLEHTTHIKRHPDSSSSSDSEDETGQVEKQRPDKVDTAGPPLQKSQSQNPDTSWPPLDLKHIPRVNRHPDIKAPLPPTDAEKIAQIKKHELGEVHVSRPTFQESLVVSHDPETQWPVLDPEHTTHTKRHQDVKVPSPPSDSSSSSDSEDEPTGHTEKQRPSKVGIPFQKSQTESRDSDTRWPALDLEHIIGIKRRQDIKASSPASDSSSSSDSEDETTNHIKQQKQGETYKARLPNNVSQTGSDDPQRKWPLIDLEYTTHLKSHLDIKAPSPASDSSSSSDSEDEARHHTKERPELMGIAGPQSQESQVQSHDPGKQWPAVDLGNITRIKRHLDIKAPTTYSDSLLSGGSTENRVEGKREEAIKISPQYSSSSSSDEQEGGMKFLRNTPTTVKPDPDSRWLQLDLGRALHVKRPLDIRVRSPPPESSSSSNESDGGTTDLALKVERDRADGGMSNYQQGTKLPHLNMRIPLVKKRLNIKAPVQQASNNESSQQSGSNSSSSDSEDENRNHAQTGLRVPAISKASEKDFIRSPLIHTSRSPKTDDNIKLKKYTVTTDDTEDKKTSDNINTTPNINPELESRWATMSLGISRFRKRLEITSDTRESTNLPSSPAPESSSSSSSENDTGSKRDRTRRKRRGAGMQEVIHTGSSLTPKNKQGNVSLSLKGHEDYSGNYSLPKTEGKSNPDTTLISFGTPHFKRDLDTKVSEKAPAKPPLRQLPDSSSSSENEDASTEYASKGWRARAQLPVVTDKEPSQIHTSLYVSHAGNEKSDSVWPHLSLTNTTNIRKAVDIRAPSQREASSSSNSENETIDHNVPDLSLGVPHVERHSNEKPSLSESSTSSSSSSGNENEVTEHTTRPSRHASDTTGMADNDSLITYKRTIFKPSLPPSNSFSQSGTTIDQRTQRQRFAELVAAAQKGPSLSVGDSNASLDPRLASISFDHVVKKRAEQFTGTTDVELPPEIRWTGVGHQLSDLSISGPRRHLDVGLSSPQRASPAEPQLPSFDSSNYSSSKSDNKIKPDRGNSDGTVTHKYSSLGASSVSLVSSRGLDKFDNSLSSTNEILRAVPEDRRELRGLSALRAMSSERHKWDTLSRNLEKGASPRFDGRDQVDASFNYQRSEDVKLLAKQPLTQSHLSSSAVDEREANLPYVIPHYRRHNIGGTEPLQEAPPPIPSTPLPDEAVGLTWRSPQSSKKQGLEGNRSYLRQSRNTEESEPSSVTSQNRQPISDSSNVNISQV